MTPNNRPYHGAWPIQGLWLDSGGGGAPPQPAAQAVQHRPDAYLPLEARDRSRQQTTLKWTNTTSRGNAATALQLYKSPQRLDHDSGVDLVETRSKVVAAFPE
jgi:hypothetical protein